MFNGGNATILRGDLRALILQKQFLTVYSMVCNWQTYLSHRFKWCLLKIVKPVKYLLRMTEFVDVIVPRGGKGLVGLVQEEARVPVFAHLEGVVHIYVDKMADAKKALDVVLNAKTRRYGICGAAECLLLHQDISHELGVEIINSLVSKTLN